MNTAPVVSVSRFRIGIDGSGIRSLVLVHGCPLRCRYCLNSQSWLQEDFTYFTPELLYNMLSVDDLYFKSTGGGVTFGGGEPALYSAFIKEFAKEFANEWSVNLQTSLQVDEDNIQELIPFIDTFWVDIKSMDSGIYNAYTGGNISRMLTNLNVLAKQCPEKVLIRIPQIPGFNTTEECMKTEIEMKKRGFQTEQFVYIPKAWQG